MINVNTDTRLMKLQSTLNDLPKSVTKKVVRQGLRKAAKPLVKAAKSNAPIGKGPGRGNLKKSIGVMTGAQRSALMNISMAQASALRADKQAVYVGPRAGRRWKYDAWYAHFVEFGTVHSAPHPFMRPAWDQTKIEVEATIADEIGAAVDRHFKLMAAKIKKI